MKLKDIKAHFSVMARDNGEYLLFNGGEYTGTIRYDSKKECVFLKSPIYADEIIMPKSCGIDSLFSAIEYIKKSLPFPLDCYNPTYRKGWFVSCCIHHYLTNIGFVQTPGGYRNTIYKLTNKNNFGVNCDIALIIANDEQSNAEINGSVTMYLSATKSLRYEFNSLDDAIKTINGLMTVALGVSMSFMIQCSEKFTNKEINLDGVILEFHKAETPLAVYTSEIKQQTIDMLESILAQLKGDK